MMVMRQHLCSNTLSFYFIFPSNLFFVDQLIMRVKKNTVFKKISSVLARL